MSELILDNKAEHETYSGYSQKMQERIEEKDRFINKRKWRKDGSHAGDNSIDNDFDEGEAIEEKEYLESEKQKIDDAVKERKRKDMDVATREFMIDMLNLIFGRGEETDYYWDQILILECSKQFEI